MRYTAIVSLAVVLGGLCAASKSEPYYDLVGEADKAIADGRYEAADSLLLTALRLEPANQLNVMLINNLGMVRHYMGRDSLALATLTDAHVMAPMSVTVLSNRARVYTDMGRMSEAYADYSRVLELDSTVIDQRYYHGMLALYAGDKATAVVDMAKLKEIAPNNIMTYRGLGAVNYATANYDAAIEAYTKLLSKEKEVSYYALRAEMYLLTDRLADCADDIASGLELDSEDAGLYLLRARLNMARYRYDDARTDGQRAIDRGADPKAVKAILQIAH
jgi:tetratricopeptide (TPR) repeat protein